jgi:hypothetical protein
MLFVAGPPSATGHVATRECEFVLFLLRNRGKRKLNRRNSFAGVVRLVVFSGVFEQ